MGLCNALEVDITSPKAPFDSDVTGLIRLTLVLMFLFQKEAVRLSKFMLGDKQFRKTFGEFLESTNIKVKNQKKKGNMCYYAAF